MLHILNKWKEAEVDMRAEKRRAALYCTVLYCTVDIVS